MFRKFGVGVLFFICLIVGCLTIIDKKLNASHHPGICQKIDNSTLELSGEIDASMMSCVETLLDETITTIIIDSPGGSSVEGRAIGYKIGEQERSLRIENYCGSSCANYFIPAASELILSRNAVIMLHGTPDPHMILMGTKHIDRDVFMSETYEKIEIVHVDITSVSHIWRGDPSTPPTDEEVKLGLALAQMPLIIEAENKFAEAFSIPLGWRLYRNENSKLNGWIEHFEFKDFKDSAKPYLQVETPMLESCLPELKVTLTDQVYPRPFYEKLSLLFSHQKSQDLKCI